MDMTTGLAHPKPRPGALDRTARRAASEKADRAENDKVKTRSEGRCEVVEEVQRFGRVWGDRHCSHRGVHVHHMIGGRGKRAIGLSLLAQHKQHVCLQCHQDITERRLVRTAREGQLPLWTDQYRRVR